MFLNKNNFICQQIDADLNAGVHKKIITRFPPEPNGYLHIGHAKSIALNFAVAAQYGGECILRFDDTNPLKEEDEFIDAIKRDVAWLGFAPARITYASDYFEKLYEFAVLLVEKGLAYVDRQSNAEIRSNRGTLTKPGIASRDRERSVADNLDLLARMKGGEFEDGEMVLRAKIDMTAANLNLRDPVLYRIRHHRHPRRGGDWCIYPLYDFAHGQSDAIENISHSLCTLEFEDHRALYDWLIQNLELQPRPRQIEFSRFNLNYTAMSKRQLTQLVEAGDVDGWDDPRMPTLCGLRRRGVPAAALIKFIKSVGITRSDNCVEYSALENFIRAELDKDAPRRMAVLNPLKVVIENYPDDSESIAVRNHPNDEELGSREISLSREIYIERDDFMQDPPKKFFRLSPGGEVRLRYAFVIKCTAVVRDANGEVVELKCQYDDATRGGVAPAGRKVKGIIHWVNAADAVDARVNIYDRLFSVPLPRGSGDELRAQLNPDSLKIYHRAKLESCLQDADKGVRYQFERCGYFCLDSYYNNRADKMIFNRIVALRDSWAKNK